MFFHDRTTIAARGDMEMGDDDRGPAMAKA
jgi:hypothetical protein